jgi:alpha-L-arabinofuranosidase
MITSKIALAALLLATAPGFLALRSPAAPAQASLTIQGDKPGPKISPALWGIFFEEINCAGDGGLYAELVRNRSFEDSKQPEHWSLLARGGEGELALEPRADGGEFNRQALKLTVKDMSKGRVALANDGYWGIAVKKGEAYQFSVMARAGDGFKGFVSVTLESKSGKVYADQKLTGLASTWTTFKATLKANGTDPAARLVLYPGGPGTVSFDMVSLFPKQTWKGRTNGLRPDLAKMLEGLKPAFVRFPGGCWVEGDNMSLAYRWKQTVGDLSRRRTQFNIWQYRSTHGLGYHEYLQLCEDLRAEAMFVINCGMSHREVVPMDQLGPYVQDALDAIEYANGPTTTKWGALRARNGHPSPFDMKYLEIGNENGGPAYEERYAAFYKAVKAKYPEIRLIANHWGGVPKSAPLEIVDEHYYNSPRFFIQNAGKYDTYDRNGPKIYVGEYAVTIGCGQGNLAGALGEAAFMTGMERNSDVVVMSSYAPLFANVNNKRWNPDLINFDRSRVYGIPSYYVQQLFAQNTGDVVLPSTVEAQAVTEEPGRGGVGLGTWETQAEYKDIRVTSDGKVLYQWDSAQGTNGWKRFSGNWETVDGVLRQSARGTDRRLLVGESGWQDYTLSLKARKTGGAEGFLIMFHARDDQNWLWWNIGGWGNNRHAIEKCTQGAKSTLGSDVAGRVETGRWYDVRIELKGPMIRCYLDDTLVHEVKDSTTLYPLHAVASRDSRSGEIIVKMVNVTDTPQETAVKIEGVKKVRSTGTAIVLTSGSPADENTLDQPQKVAPVRQKLQNAAQNFRYTFPAHSLTVLRLGTTN